jgi:hypothetical protein
VRRIRETRERREIWGEEFFGEKRVLGEEEEEREIRERERERDRSMVLIFFGK